MKIQFVLVLFIPFCFSFYSEASSNGPTFRSQRCRKILADSESPDVRSGWTHQLPMSNGMLDLIRAPESSSQKVMTMILSKKTIPSPQEMRDVILSSIPKKYHAIFLGSHEGTRSELAQLKRDFKTEYSNDLYNYLIKPKPIVTNSGVKGLYRSYEEFVLSIEQTDPAGLKKFEDLIMSHALKDFSMYLAPPTVRQIASTLNFKGDGALEFIFAITSRPKFWDRAMRSSAGLQDIMRARNRIAQAYARATRGTDSPNVWRTKRVKPTLRRMAEIMILTASNTHYKGRTLGGLFGEYDMTDPVQKEQVLDILMVQLGHLIGITDENGDKLFDVNSDPAYHSSEWVMSMPRLFNDIDHLHNASKNLARGTFNSFVNEDILSVDNANRLIEKIENSKGMLISSFTPGRPINWALVEGMKDKAREEGKIVVLFPEEGLLEGADERLLNDPELNILPTTIENSALKLWAHPNRGRKKAIAGIKDVERVQHKGTVIIPHHTMEHFVKPSGENKIENTKVYSTGTINTSTVGGVGPSQGAKAQEIHDMLKQGFLVVEMVNNVDEDFPIQNRWHVRPVEWRQGTSFADQGFTDNFVKRVYKVEEDGKVTKAKYRNKPRVFYLPDVHFISANPMVMKGIVDYINKVSDPDDEIIFVLPDPIDSKAINHHVEKTQGDLSGLSRMLKSGELDFNREVNQAIASVNEFLELFPRGQVLFQYSNHSDDWIKKNLISKHKTQLQDVANGRIAKELAIWEDNNSSMAPIEYLLLHREENLVAANKEDPDRHYRENVYIPGHQKDRIRVLYPGEPLPSSRDELYSTRAENHGNLGSNGARSSPSQHIEGLHRQITGDRHSPGYLAKGVANFWIGVGASSLFQNYTDRGGYSSWGLAMGVLHDDDTMTLVYMDHKTGTFVQEDGLPLLSGQRFFAGNPLQAVGTVDDFDLRQQRDSREFMKWLDEEIPFYQPGLIDP